MNRRGWLVNWYARIGDRRAIRERREMGEENPENSESREKSAPCRGSSTGVVEEVDRRELSYKAIKARSDAFNHAFAHNGGYKGYEVQAIESLLAQLESAYDAQREAERETARALSAHAIEARQLRGELAVMREQVKDWHRIADERAAEIVRLQQGG